MDDDADGAIVVIGIGNPLRGDDAVGKAVARRMRVRPGMRVIEQGGEAVALLDALRGVRAAFVIDAALGTQPGRVWRFDAAAEPLPQRLAAYSTHGFGVAEGIELARALAALPPVCVVYAIECRHFEIDTAISPALCASVPDVAARVEREIDALLGHYSGVADA